MMMSGRKRVPIKKSKVLKEAGSDFCENTSLHGFAYWVSSSWCCVNYIYTLILKFLLFVTIENGLERAFWVVIVFICFGYALYLVSSQMSYWRHNPTGKQQHVLAMSFIWL